MKSSSKLIRPSIASLSPYSCARDDYSGASEVFLDANENPWGKFNRYPDSSQKELKKLLELKTGIAFESIFIGNGSDEIIDLCFRIFCEPGKDKVMLFPPSYGMYQVYAGINNVGVINVPLLPDFSIDSKAVKKLIADPDLKLIIICSPNNPTGNVMDYNTICWICESFNGIVLLDEAYADFSATTLLPELSKYSRLIVSRTLSKARALAAARIGIAYASAEIISIFNKVKPPYNVSGLNQQAAIDSLMDDSEYNSRIKTIIEQRLWLEKKLSSLSMVKKVWPSDANFLFVEVEDANKLYVYLIKHGIIIRNRHAQIKNCIRITIGSPNENEKLLSVLIDYCKKKNDV